MWHQCRASCNFIGCRLYRSASSGHRQTKFILGRVHISWTISWACHEPRQRVTLSSLNLSHISQIWGRTSESSVLCYFGGLSLSPSPSPGVQHLAEGEPRTAWQFKARAQLLGVLYHQAKQQVTLKSLLLYKVLKRRQSRRESELRVH